MLKNIEKHSSAPFLTTEISIEKESNRLYTLSAYSQGNYLPWLSEMWGLQNELQTDDLIAADYLHSITLNLQVCTDGINCPCTTC